MKIFLIQDILAPYRIPLFKKIAETPDVDFRLILLSEGVRNKPQWKFDFDRLPFDCRQSVDLSFYYHYDKQINLSFRLLFEFIKEKPDVVVCAGYPFATIEALVYSKIFRKKYIIWMEGTKYTESTRNSFLRILQRKFLSRHADALVDAGTESHKYLKSLLPPQSQIPFFTSFNAVDNDTIYSETRRYRENPELLREFRARFPAQNILFVGQLIERKGVHQLIAAYKQVLAKSSGPVGLIVLGFGPLADEIERMKQSDNLHHLYLEGFIEQDVYPKYLAVADVMVLPSLYDPNPLVVFEALAAGLPMVLSNRAGNAADFIEGGRNGYVVDPEDVEEIAERVLAVLNASESKKRDMSAASLAMVKKANYDDSARAFVEAARYAVGQDG